MKIFKLVLLAGLFSNDVFAANLCQANMIQLTGKVLYDFYAESDVSLATACADARSLCYTARDKLMEAGTDPLVFGSKCVIVTEYQPDPILPPAPQPPKVRHTGNTYFICERNDVCSVFETTNIYWWMDDIKIDKIDAPSGCKSGSTYELSYTTEQIVHITTSGRCSGLFSVSYSYISNM